ncbi:putative transporter [Wigglesworthia glossinidia endosymbiont of Glossina morsitans morsitans (Yale colony)]|uniref:Putative transporter n=1 Tax=Wigglesworthia glossinidia endosymbiont of Glossina morsitans morsitans (Yale colony) TaxID=1142511 RepID=H6Q5F5_WIGGL|nr:MFS transporter [Wigglesworthia glossinidia]AFA41438.1 putative transporter [Wigglesworthia glossinidia endosymbiont of Glossina morsitans morsitans (Yale colony)]
MNSIELRSILSLGIIFACRMFGIFMILPVLSNHGMIFQGATTSLIGLAIGIYGITQSIFQIPFGLLSDKYGRHTLILVGLILIVFGSIISGVSNNIWGVILGRAMQGSGAISSVVMALLTDLICEKNRIKAMAFIGLVFGITFAVSIIIGPILATYYGIRSIFWITALLAVISMFLILFIVPHHQKLKKNHDTKIFINAMKNILNNKLIVYLIFCIFFLHTILISNFIVFPFLIKKMGYSEIDHWKIYFFSLLCSTFFLILVFSRYVKKIQNKIKQVLYFFIIILFISEITLLLCSKNIYFAYLGIPMFFLGFSALEIMLPTYIGKQAPSKYKGTAMGIYTTSQFCGVAFGGIIGGLLFSNKNAFLVFLFLSIMILVWIIFSLKLEKKI